MHAFFFSVRQAAMKCFGETTVRSFVQKQGIRAYEKPAAESSFRNRL
jgi:hypothetical protein